MGSAVACSLAMQPGFGGKVVVIERDTSYRGAATSLSASSIRQQFSAPINIAISQFGYDFLCNVQRYLAVDEEPIDVGLVKRSYLYLATQAGARALQQSVEAQVRSSVDARFMDPEQLKQTFPWIDTTSIAGAAITGSGEGWFDAYALLQAFKRRARASGVEYLSDEATSIVQRGASEVEVRLQSGETLNAEWCVIAAGTRAPAFAAANGFEIPVTARKRCVFVFKCRETLPGCPLVIDPSGLWFRPEGDRFICGIPPPLDAPVAVDDFEVDHNLFEELLWPLLAQRVPAFESIACVGAWAGHYDYNAFDQNAFIGPLPGKPRLLIASGFSGHGLQQAPGVGRALAEWIVHGRYVSLDLTPLSCDRLLRNEPLVEANVI